MSWWAFTSYFSWNKPTEIKGLRLYTENKLNEYYKSGNFWFTLESKVDKLPTLLISSKPETPVHDEHKKIAAPTRPDDFIVGTYEAQGSTGAGNYTFTIDMGTNAAYVNKILKDKGISLKFWSSFAIAQPSAISLNDTPLMKRKMLDAKWTVAQWNLTRVLTLKGKEGVLDGEPLPGKWLTAPDGKTRQFGMPGGVMLAESMPVKVEAEGALVDRAKDSALIMQMMRDPVTAIMKQQGEELKQKLIAIDGLSAVLEKDAAKQRMEKLLHETLDAFESELNEVCVKAVHEEWCKYVVNKIEYKEYVYACRVSVAKSAVGVTFGIVGAAVGSLAGPVAVLGLLSTIKSALDLATDLYGMFRDLSDLSMELDLGLNHVLEKYKSTDKKLVGAIEVFKAFIEHLPGGSGVKVLAAKVGVANKDIAALEKDVETYAARVRGFLPKGEETAGGLDEALKEAELARTELAKSIAQGGANQAQLEALSRKLNAVETGVTTLLEEAIDHFKKWDSGLKKATEYGKILEAIKKESPKTAEIIKAALPALELVYAVNPKAISGALLSIISVSTDVATGLIDVLKASAEDPKSENAKKILAMIKETTTTASNIKSLVSAIKKFA